jgi:hypothetical protein
MVNVMPSKIDDFKPRVCTLQSAAVTTLTVTQLIACFKLLPATSVWGLGAQIFSLAGLYVGTRWSIENYIESKVKGLPVTIAQQVENSPVTSAPQAQQLPHVQSHQQPQVAPPVTPARAIQAAKGKTRGFTKHMLDDVINKEPELIPLKDRKSITTINFESFSLEPINAYPSSEVFITASNHALVINEYARHLISNERFDNPYTRQPLERTDITKLLEYQSIKDTVSLYRIPTNKMPQKHAQRHNTQYHR